MQCIGCGCEEFKFLGTMGSLDHYRCVDCGLNVSERADDGLDDDELPQDDPADCDDFADGE